MPADVASAPERAWLAARPAPRLRVGFVTPNLLIGGVEHWFLGVARCSRSQIEWAAAVTNPAAVENEMRTKTAEFAPVGVGAAAVRGLARWADVIVTWGVHDLTGMISGFHGPVVLVSHGCCAWTRQFVASCRRVATHFVAVSQAAATPFGDAKVTVIANGVDARRCLPSRPREQVRREWGLGQSDTAVGYVGRFSWEKNPIAVSQAVAALGNGYRAVYVGKGYGPGVCEGALRLTPDAVFVDPLYQVGDAYHALDCVIMASPSEGFSMVLVEAMLAGVPVVATRVGIVPELERNHGISCVTVPIHPSAAQLAEAVRVAVSPGNRAVVEKLRRVALAKYTAEAMGRQWADYLLAIARA
ncbi:MAG: glycosyltransferase family 4 protein [Planctomycetia bacterium]|nr:glycosyltransferase family 4 protein [Planctomycetia bacterium]